MDQSSGFACRGARSDGPEDEAAMAPETRELLEVLIALSLWFAFVAALAWSALHSLISHYRERSRSQILKPRRTR